MTRQPVGGVVTIRESWAQFSRLVFGEKKPSAIQYQEMRRAFYAGFQGCMSVSLEIARLDDGARDEKALRAMDALQREMVDFAREMLDGEA